MQYEGTFEYGAFNGEGVLDNEQGIHDLCKENFQSGAYHGQGIMLITDSGIMKYVGEFYMGREQGKGIRYASSGRELFEAQFGQGSLFSMNLFWASRWKMRNVMLKETPDPLSTTVRERPVFSMRKK